MRNILITGAAGFIGNALFQRLQGRYNLIGLDDLSRETSLSPVVEGDGDLFIKGSLYGEEDPFDTLPSLDAIIHLAAQVSVTDSVKDPIVDCRTNIEGSLRMCLLAKKHGCPLLYSSTNKVFGELPDACTPILDSQPLTPSTPYGISKCAGAQYILDILPSSGYVFHQSCIYGETQIGTIDQGWVGWLRNCIKQEIPITCFGDGSQVRDLLHVEDLLDLYELVLDNKISPGAYVTGGGEENAYNFKEVVDLLGGGIDQHGEWRPCDQKYFVSANEGLEKQGWYPKISFKRWVLDDRSN